MAASDAQAQTPAYVGTWGVNAAQCRLDQGVQGAPMILKRNGYDQHEAHCTFTSVRKAGPDTWRVRARCSVEGDRQRHDFTLKVQGTTLTIGEAGGARALRRCG